MYVTKFTEIYFQLTKLNNDVDNLKNRDHNKLTLRNFLVDVK